MSNIKVTAEEFKTFATYILDISGIALGVGKEYLLETRLNPLLSKYQCHSYSDLMKKSKHGFDKKLEGEIIDAISTNETYFFRDKTPFKLLQHKILPDLIDKRSKTSIGKPTIRIWSAANSTGQEIYSIAMTMIEMGVTLDNYNIRLLGTDISDAAIAKASYGVYNKFEVARGLEPARLNRFFQPMENNTYKVKDELRAMVQFKKMNLMKPFIGIGKYDIVLCRNVMIYFTTEDRRKIYSNISKVMEPDGYLLIGSTESLVNDTDLFASFRYLNSVFYQFKR
ncbi:MAG: chemotaxis protein CheR [Desulfobacter postgatei]|uniref:protein-glutamate O-methyltransferase n=1 Tax=Desulfobacter postgatei TaxID=2293 RepID=A0A2G6MRZ4_9BACT|nr:MAG: chemotaxis protein CheR [Desulfobacter postgatei]